MNRLAVVCLGLFFTSLLFNFSAFSSDRVAFLPGYGKIKGLQLAGYLPLSSLECTQESCDSEIGHLFYWFVEKSQPSEDAPVVLWLNGGPGAASLYGFFMENGPYLVNPNGTLSARHDSWTQDANYLVIDQPAGVGFSYGKQNSYLNESQAMDQLHHAVKFFFAKYPEWASRPLYLAGESYAGKYLPQLAVRILSDNQSGQSINLKGLFVGDPWVNPRLQQLANIEFAYSHGLIDRRARKKVLTLYQQCIKEIDKVTPSSRRANKVCEKIQEFIQKESGGLNLANIATGTEPDDGAMVRYLNRSDVRKALHVDSRVAEFKTFSTKAAYILEVGEQDSVADLYPILLAAGIRVLIYNGLEDAKDSNFISTDLWLSALDWSGKKEFAKASTCVWRTGKEVNGYAKSGAGLTQVKIRGAGHLAPIDQPARALNLFRHFIKDQPLC
ncbi:S10 family serine carboxypeptidase-like protein [Legionella nagasakiensis]|uniref:S10 family serine carboxypeptidase-like protein n=1 Tax=Legionella nagasakiensis TaxID=535290 RepID=UPI00105480E5|nr:peptidase S10 [Legionella nagasakiensis]